MLFYLPVLIMCCHNKWNFLPYFTVEVNPLSFFISWKLSLIKWLNVSTAKHIICFGALEKTSLATHRLTAQAYSWLQYHIVSICKAVSSFSLSLQWTSVLNLTWCKCLAACVNKELLKLELKDLGDSSDILNRMAGECLPFGTGNRERHISDWLVSPDPTTSVMVVPLGLGHTQTLQNIWQSPERSAPAKERNEEVGGKWWKLIVYNVTILIVIRTTAQFTANSEFANVYSGLSICMTVLVNVYFLLKA